MKVLGLGNALIDVLARVHDDKILEEMALPLGSMTLIDEKGLLKIQEYFETLKTHMVIGGSAGNSIRGLAQLGVATGFVGKVGKDTFGDFYTNYLQQHHIEGKLFIDPEYPTGVASTFISPNGERTFGTYLGAAARLTVDELHEALFAGYDYLIIEGYVAQDRELAFRALDLAKKQHLQVCMDLASYNIVRRDIDFFHRLVRDYVDVVFANEEEAHAYTGCEQPEEALAQLSRECRIAVVKVGPKGSYVKQGDTAHFVPAHKVEKVIDTTGAGDLFAAGFLYGLVTGKDLETAAQIGTILAEEVIQVIGTELPKATWEKIIKQVEQYEKNK